MADPIIKAVDSRTLAGLQKKLTGALSLEGIELQIRDHLHDISHEEFSKIHTDLGYSAPSPFERRSKLSENFAGEFKDRILTDYKESLTVKRDVQQAFEELGKPIAQHGGKSYYSPEALEKFQAKMSELSPKLKAIETRYAVEYPQAKIGRVFAGGRPDLGSLLTQKPGTLAGDINAGIRDIEALANKTSAVTEQVKVGIKDIIPDIEKRMSRSGGMIGIGNKNVTIDLKGLTDPQKLALDGHLRESFAGKVNQGIGKAGQTTLVISGVKPTQVAKTLETFEHVLIDPTHGHLPIGTKPNIPAVVEASVVKPPAVAALPTEAPKPLFKARTEPFKVPPHLKGEGEYGVRSILSKMERDKHLIGHPKPHGDAFLHPNVVAKVEGDIAGTLQHLERERVAALGKGGLTTELSHFNNLPFGKKDEIIRHYAEDLQAHFNQHGNLNLPDEYERLSKQFTGVRKVEPVAAFVHTPVIPKTPIASIEVRPLPATASEDMVKLVEAANEPAVAAAVPKAVPAAVAETASSGISGLPKYKDVGTEMARVQAEARQVATTVAADAAKPASRMSRIWNAMNAPLEKQGGMLGWFGRRGEGALSVVDKAPSAMWTATRGLAYDLPKAGLNNIVKPGASAGYNAVKSAAGHVHGTVGNVLLAGVGGVALLGLGASLSSPVRATPRVTRFDDELDNGLAFAGGNASVGVGGIAMPSLGQSQGQSNWASRMPAQGSVEEQMLMNNFTTPTR